MTGPTSLRRGRDRSRTRNGFIAKIDLSMRGQGIASGERGKGRQPLSHHRVATERDSAPESKIPVFRPYGNNRKNPSQMSPMQVASGTSRKLPQERTDRLLPRPNR